MRNVFLLLVLLGQAGCLSPHGLCLVPPEDLFIYQPAGPHSEEWQPPDLDYEDVHFTTPDGVRLHGWYCPVDSPRGTVLFCHGNAGNITYRYPDLLMLTKEMKLNVFAFDYRGYGRSEGVPNEKGLLIDARAARQWLAEREQIDRSQIVLFGRSLGGAVTVDLAAKDGAQALILESTFTSLPEVANDLLPLSPGLLMLSRFDSINKIANYQGPLLIAHGTQDKLIPFAHGKQLFDAANEPKQLVPITGADHNWTPPPGYLQALDAFLDNLPAKK